MKNTKRSELQLITTDDGSHSLYVPSLNETYHSFHGALQESEHVFIQMGLAHHLQCHDAKNEISVFEVGLGTGLNALLTAMYAHDNKVRLEYSSIEAFPVPLSIINQLNYPSLFKTSEAIKWFHQMHQSEWNERVRIHEHFYLRKIHDKLEHFTPEVSTFDIVYFDAFAPNKQEEMWSALNLQKVYSMMKSGGTFVTYCAKGQLKRDLKTIGFSVETIPGPPGKKEIVRATKPE